MQSKSYTISPNSDGYDSNALTSVLRVFAIVFFVGGLIGGYVLGKQFSDIQNLFATSYRDRVDFSWGGRHCCMALCRAFRLAHACAS